MSIFNFFKISFISRTKVEEVGNAVLYEETYNLAPSLPSDANIINIGYQNLLPSNNLISVREASKIYGLKEKEIRELCRNNEIEAIKVGRNWLISRDSLEKYVDSIDGLIDESTFLSRKH